MVRVKVVPLDVLDHLSNFRTHPVYKNDFFLPTFVKSLVNSVEFKNRRMSLFYMNKQG